MTSAEFTVATMLRRFVETRTFSTKLTNIQL